VNVKGRIAIVTINVQTREREEKKTEERNNGDSKRM